MDPNHRASAVSQAPSAQSTSEASSKPASIKHDDISSAENGQAVEERAPHPVEEKSGWRDQQSNILPHKKLMVVFPILALVQFTSYLDQTTISTAVPVIGADLNLGPSVPWVASSFLIASTSIQLINGRLSDIFGRKQLLLIGMCMLATGNLIASFSINGPMLYFFRGFSGLGGGITSALVMIVASDITTLKQRGKYNGFIGLAVALGNGLGPLMGGILTEKAGWRWSIRYDVPWVAIVATLMILTLPKSKISGRWQDKLKLIDWLGVFLNVAAVLLILIPLSEGGSQFPWNGPLVISMLTLGGVTVLAFLFVEWKVAKLPMMPLHLFTNDYSANIILLQAALFGFVYWGNLYYVPIYIQNVRGYNPIISGALLIPLVATQGVGSLVGGQIISRTGHYNPVLITSQAVWTIGAGLQIIYSATTPIWAICVIGFLQGIGVGGAFQPSLVALLAHSRKADRAVINSLRNFLRTMGGAIGLTVSGTILGNTLKSQLSGTLSQSTIQDLTASSYTLKTLNLSPAEHQMVQEAYRKGINYIFIVYTPLIGLCFLLSLLVRDHGVAEKDATAAERKAAMGKSDEKKADEKDAAQLQTQEEVGTSAAATTANEKL